MTRIVPNINSFDNSVPARAIRELFNYGYIPERFPNEKIARTYFGILIRHSLFSDTNKREAIKLVRFIKE